MNWADPVIATALAIVAGRSATAARNTADTPWTWSARDVWLTRVKPPGALSPRCSLRGSSTPADQGTVLRNLNHPA